MVLALPGTVVGGAVSAGGPWSYGNQYTTCTFSGDHGSQNNQAFARTTNFNGACRGLAVRLKSNPGAVVSGWFEVSGGFPGNVRVFDLRAGSTAVASQHRGQEHWWESWSPVEQPHAW